MTNQKVMRDFDASYHFLGFYLGIWPLWMNSDYKKNQ